MFSSKEHKHEYNFHGDDTLHDQTPEVQSILAGLPSGAAAVGQLLVNGTGVMLNYQYHLPMELC